MTLKGHKKHANISKPLGGGIHKNEFAIMGAPCGVIQQLSNKIASQLNQYKVGYIDAEHGNGEPKDIYTQTYTDKISFHSLTSILTM